ncbi:MFS general substrate transporter [Martensiomyces pterosporus]|nr:MFS general substrate transporter [Martensiomyces pterosporus]
MANTYEFEVAMSCSGCSGAVERALKRLEKERDADISTDISLETQRVKVTTDLPRETILETIKKTGKAVPKRDSIIDFSALKNYRFVVLFFSSLFAAGGYYMPYYYMPSFSVVVLKENQAWGSNVSSILNAGSIAGRILTGILADRIGSLNTLFLSSLISCLSIFILWLPFKHLGTLVAAAVIFGFTSGSIVSLVPVATANLFGIRRLPSILGLLFLSFTMGSLICTPVGGALLDKYGHKTNFTSLIIYDGVFFSVASFLMLALRLSLKWSPFAKV